MAQITENEKGFKVICVGRAELVDRLAGFGAIGVCDTCCESPKEGYYVAVLNQWLCPRCYEEWSKEATYCPEDKRVEERNYHFYKKIFGVK